MYLWCLERKWPTSYNIYLSPKADSVIALPGNYELKGWHENEKPNNFAWEFLS